MSGLEGLLRSVSVCGKVRGAAGTWGTAGPTLSHAARLLVSYRYRLPPSEKNHCFVFSLKNSRVAVATRLDQRSVPPVRQGRCGSRRVSQMLSLCSTQKRRITQQQLLRLESIAAGVHLPNDCWCHGEGRTPCVKQPPQPAQQGGCCLLYASVVLSSPQGRMGPHLNLVSGVKTDDITCTHTKRVEKICDAHITELSGRVGLAPSREKNDLRERRGDWLAWMVLGEAGWPAGLNDSLDPGGRVCRLSFWLRLCGCKMKRHSRP